MKKIIPLFIIILFCFTGLALISEVEATQYCTLHSRDISMAKIGTTATCTKSGVNIYRCYVCRLSGKTTIKTESQSALGHSFDSNHTCTRCGKEMNGHWFKLDGGSYKCIVCSKFLIIESISPNLTYKTGYRAVPYDNPTYITGNIKVTFNAVPYNSNGELMTVTGTSTRYVARNAAYHWGENIPSDDIIKAVFPPYYKNGKAMDTRDTYTSTVKGAKSVWITTPSAGKYVFSVSVNGVRVGSDRRYVKGSSASDDSATNQNDSVLTIKHIDITTGKEIVDKEYTKEVKFNGSTVCAYSLPVGSNTNYKNYINVSYKINNNSEVTATSSSQYIVKVPASTSDTTITFYYSIPELTVKHILESTNKEIIDNELTLKTNMNRPSNIAFSLDVYNKYPILELTGYSLDGNRVDISSENQYAVTVDWNDNSRNLIFYYKYKEVNVNVIVRHIDISTGELMKGTSELKYSMKNIPNSITSLNLNNYKEYENSGVYMGGKYTSKSGKTQYTMSVDISNINYSTDYVIELYYAPKTGETYNYEIMDAIPDELLSSEVAKLASNVINKEKYDVESAIPTSENLYASVRVYNYILRYSFNKITDISISKVTFVQPYICNGETKNVTTVYEVPVSATYYKLNYLEVYKADSAEITNKVLPGETVTLNATKDVSPTIKYTVPSSYIYYDKEMDKTITLPTLEVPDMKYVKNVVGSEEYARSEAVSVANVRNDELIIDGKVITSGEWQAQNALAPNKIVPSIMAEKVLYKDGYTISAKNENGTYQSTGKVIYKKIKNINGTSSETIEKAITPNAVTIHTPVVNNTTLDNSEALSKNQKISNLAVSSSGVTAKALILNEKFTVKISNSGTHISSKGYGSRVYNANQGVLKNSYAKLKQIKFPFDVYIVNGNKEELINANTWYTLSVKEETFEFLLSKSAKEGAYDSNGNEYYIETRVIAENAIVDENLKYSQEKANTDIKNYVATNKVFVEVIGRLYDLTITNTTDPAWKLEEDLAVKEQPVGQSGQVNSKYQYALKLGYSVRFNVKTLGLKSSEIVMKPKYYYIDKTTGEVQEVDLYYHTTTQKYVKLDENKIVDNVTYKDYVGTWTSEYKLPASTLATPKGTKLPTGVTDSNKIFLKNGYILVQFEVETNYKSWQYLSYSKPNINTQWQKENAVSKITLPNGKKATINGVGNFVIYEASVRANNDYEIGGTH